MIMKIDLVGVKNRGLAMGLNEFSGYLAVGVVAFLSGYIANIYGITPYPFYIGIGISVVGLIMSYLFIKDTRSFVTIEKEVNDTSLLQNIFLDTTFKNKTLSSVTQAGLVNNLNDGMIWGLLPVMLLDINYDAQEIGIIAAVYPTVWGIGQLFTGRMADVYSKKALLFWGMLLQGIAILLFPFSDNFVFLVTIAFTLGMGTALVYPTFLSVIAASTNPVQRAESIGAFRFWRDSGYAIGAIMSGIIADSLGVSAAIIIIGFITLSSAVIIKLRMPVEKIFAKV